MSNDDENKILHGLWFNDLDKSSQVHFPVLPCLRLPQRMELQSRRKPVQLVKKKKKKYMQPSKFTSQELEQVDKADIQYFTLI